MSPEVLALAGVIGVMASFWVVEYRRNQTKHDDCERKLDQRAEAYHGLAERLLVAIERRKVDGEPKPDGDPKP